MAVTQKIFIVEFGQKSRFLFHHIRVTTILSPLEGWVHHIDYMFIHLSCMYRDEKWVPYESTTILNEKTWKMKNVLTITSIFKSWSFWKQAWLASSLLEQILRNYSREVSFQSTYHLCSKPNNDLARRNWGQTWSRAWTQLNISAKAFVGRLIERELHHICRMEPVLVLPKNNHLCLIMPSFFCCFMQITHWT